MKSENIEISYQCINRVSLILFIIINQINQQRFALNKSL